MSCPNKPLKPPKRGFKREDEVEDKPINKKPKPYISQYNDESMKTLRQSLVDDICGGNVHIDICGKDVDNQQKIENKKKEYNSIKEELGKLYASISIRLEKRPRPFGIGIIQTRMNEIYIEKMNISIEYNNGTITKDDILKFFKRTYVDLISIYSYLIDNAIVCDDNEIINEIIALKDSSGQINDDNSTIASNSDDDNSSISSDSDDDNEEVVVNI